MWLTRLSERCQHRQRLDETHLFHSEWNRRLGLCSLIGIGGSLCLSTTFFFILPHAFATAESRSVPLLPLAFAVALQVLAAYQLSTIAKQIPRNCLLYNFAYATHSECLAFAVAWSQLFDGLCFIAVLAHCLSDHVNMLFNNVVVNYLRFDAPWIAHGSSWNIDVFVVAAVLICGVLSCCSLRVLSTISIIFLISALFTTTSTTVVALLHNAAHLNVEYIGLPASYDEAIRVSSWFLIGFLCLECFSFVPEETEQAQRIVPPFFTVFSKISFGVTLLAVLAFFPFTYRMPFTEQTLLPTTFGTINIFSARYLQTVGAVCGLSAALLCAFLPPSRLLCTLSRDGLMPFRCVGGLYGKAGSPRCAVVLVTLVAVPVAVLPREWTMHMLPLNICIRMFCQAILVFKSCYFDAEYDEKLRDKLPSYNRMCPQTSTTDSIKGHCGSETSDDEADEHALEKVWRVTQKSFDQQSRGSTANASSQSESSGLLTTRSDAGHNYKTIQNNGRHLPPAKVRHNCLTSPCTQSNAASKCCDEHHDGFHVYDPEGSESKKAQRLSLISNKITQLDPHDRLPDRLLTSFVILTALAFVAHRILGQTEGHVPLIALIALIVSVVILITITFFVWRIRLNEEDSPWKPLNCLASIFLLIHILCETTLLKCAVAFCWTVIGLVAYFVVVFRRL